MKARLARAILFVKHVQPMVDFCCGVLGLEKGAIEVNGQFLQEPLVYCDFIDPEGNVFQLSQI